MFGVVVGLEGMIAGHSSSPSTPGDGDGDGDFLNNFSLASISERRMIGDLEQTVATGRLGRGLSEGLPGCGGRGILVVFSRCLVRLGLWPLNSLRFTACSLSPLIRFACSSLNNC